MNHSFPSKAENFYDLTDLREHDSLNVHVFIYSWLSHSPFRMFGCSILGIQRCRKYTSCSWWWSFEILKAQKQPIATWLHLKGLAIVLPQDCAQNCTFTIDWNYFTKYRESLSIYQNHELNTSDWNWKVCQLCFYKPELCPAPRQLTTATKVISCLLWLFQKTKKFRIVFCCYKNEHLFCPKLVFML